MFGELPVLTNLILHLQSLARIHSGVIEAPKLSFGSDLRRDRAGRGCCNGSGATEGLMHDLVWLRRIRMTREGGLIVIWGRKNGQ